MGCNDALERTFTPSINTTASVLEYAKKSLGRPRPAGAKLRVQGIISLCLQHTTS